MARTKKTQNKEKTQSFTTTTNGLIIYLSNSMHFQKFLNIFIISKHMSDVIATFYLTRSTLDTNQFLLCYTYLKYKKRKHFNSSIAHH